MRWIMQYIKKENIFKPLASFESKLHKTPQNIPPNCCKPVLLCGFCHVFSLWNQSVILKFVMKIKSIYIMSV